MTRILCLFCKEALEPLAGRVITPISTFNRKTSWFTCDGCGHRGPHVYRVKEEDETVPG